MFGGRDAPKHQGSRQQSTWAIRVRLDLNLTLRLTSCANVNESLTFQSLGFVVYKTELTRVEGGGMAG